jgi:hypothetical protein
MRDNKENLSPQTWMPLYFDEDVDKKSSITKEEIDELVEEMRIINKQRSGDE